jgi:hypothetical protein
MYDFVIKVASPWRWSNGRLKQAGDIYFKYSIIDVLVFELLLYLWLPVDGTWSASKHMTVCLKYYINSVVVLCAFVGECDWQWTV